MTIYEAVQSCMDDWKKQSEAAKEPGFDAQAAADRALELFEEAMAEWLTHNGFSTDHNETDPDTAKSGGGPAMDPGD